MSEITKRDLAMLKDRRELALVQIGFCIGQQLEVYKEARTYAPPFALLIPDLQAKLLLAVESCKLEPKVASTLRGMIDEQNAWLENADTLIDQMGPHEFFDQLSMSCRRLGSSLREVFGTDDRLSTCLRVGEWLGQSSGNPPRFLIESKSERDGKQSWGYRESSPLNQALRSLEMDLEQISGLPRGISTFTTRLHADDERFHRYPRDRWGWAFIEDRLQALQRTLPSSPAAYRHSGERSKESDKTSDKQADQEARLEKLERADKKRPKSISKRVKVRNQRNKFSCPRRRMDPQQTWQEIYEAYSEKYKDDTKASSASLRLTHDRNCQECFPKSES